MMFIFFERDACNFVWTYSMLSDYTFFVSVMRQSKLFFKEDGYTTS